MKSNCKKLVILCLSIGIFLGCKSVNLEDFQLIDTDKTTVNSGKISGEITKTNEEIIVPLDINLGQPAAKAFDVLVQADQDIAADYLSSLTDTENLVVIDAGAVFLPNSIAVSFGASTAQFELKVSRVEAEKYFGKRMIVGYKLTNAGKGNLINPNQSEGIIIINTTDVLVEEDLHLLSVSNGAGEILHARNLTNYESSSSGITIPIGVTLSSFPGLPFRVSVETNTDTIASLIDQGVLPQNTVVLKSNEYTINRFVDIPSNTRTAPLSLGVNWPVINANIDKQLAVVVKLTSATRHIIHPTQNYTVVLIDAASVAEKDVTNEGTLTVSRENTSNVNETSPKLIDNNVDTKFLIFDYAGELWCKLTYETPKKIGFYTLTSANDAQGRDPNAWILEGSNDGQNWTLVDQRSGESFPNRKQTRRFKVDIPREYMQYRINFTSIVGDTRIQIAEWRMISVH